VQYKLAVTRCLRYRAPITSSTAACQSPKFPAANISGQPSQTEYSAVSSQHIWHLWAFSVAGPTIWNSLPDSLRDPAVESDERFRQDLKTHLFARHRPIVT